MIFREVEDRDLILKAQRGDVDAYNLLVSRWEKRVFNYLLRLVRNREDALDLVEAAMTTSEPVLGSVVGPLTSLPDDVMNPGVFVEATPAPGRMGARCRTG